MDIHVEDQDKRIQMQRGYSEAFINYVFRLKYVKIILVFKNAIAGAAELTGRALHS